MTHAPEGVRVWDHRRMIVTLEAQGFQTMEQIRAFLEGAQVLDFEGPREGVYDWIAGELRRFGYVLLQRLKKRLVRR